MLESRAEVLRVYEGMAALGIVEHVGEKHLGRFRAVRYPEKGHAPEAALLEKIRTKLTGAPSALEPPDATATEATATHAGPSGAQAPDSAKTRTNAPEPRTIALIALLQAAGLLGNLFPEVDRVRASELAKDYWPSRAVEVRLAEEEAANL